MGCYKNIPHLIKNKRWKNKYQNITCKYIFVLQEKHLPTYLDKHLPEKLGQFEKYMANKKFFAGENVS